MYNNFFEPLFKKTDVNIISNKILFDIGEFIEAQSDITLKNLQSSLLLFNYCLDVKPLALELLANQQLKAKLQLAKIRIPQLDSQIQQILEKLPLIEQEQNCKSELSIFAIISDLNRDYFQLYLRVLRIYLLHHDTNQWLDQIINSENGQEENYIRNWFQLLTSEIVSLNQESKDRILDLITYTIRQKIEWIQLLIEEDVISLLISFLKQSQSTIRSLILFRDILEYNQVYQSKIVVAPIISFLEEFTSLNKDQRSVLIIVSQIMSAISYTPQKQSIILQQFSSEEDIATNVEKLCLLAICDQLEYSEDLISQLMQSMNELTLSEQTLISICLIFEKMLPDINLILMKQVCSTVIQMVTQKMETQIHVTPRVELAYIHLLAQINQQFRQLITADQIVLLKQYHSDNVKIMRQLDEISRFNNKVFKKFRENNSSADSGFMTQSIRQSLKNADVSQSSDGKDIEVVLDQMITFNLKQGKLEKIIMCLFDIYSQTRDNPEILYKYQNNIIELYLMYPTQEIVIYYTRLMLEQLDYKSLIRNFFEDIDSYETDYQLFFLAGFTILWSQFEQYNKTIMKLITNWILIRIDLKQLNKLLVICFNLNLKQKQLSNHFVKQLNMNNDIHLDILLYSVLARQQKILEPQLLNNLLVQYLEDVRYDISVENISSDNLLRFKCFLQLVALTRNDELHKNINNGLAQDLQFITFTQSLIVCDQLSCLYINSQLSGEQIQELINNSMALQLIFKILSEYQLEINFDAIATSKLLQRYLVSMFSVFEFLIQQSSLSTIIIELQLISTFQQSFIQQAQRSLKALNEDQNMILYLQVLRKIYEYAEYQQLIEFKQVIQTLQKLLIIARDEIVIEIIVENILKLLHSLFTQPKPKTYYKISCLKDNVIVDVGVKYRQFRSLIEQLLIILVGQTQYDLQYSEKFKEPTLTIEQDQSSSPVIVETLAAEYMDTILKSSLDKQLGEQVKQQQPPRKYSSSSSSSESFKSPERLLVTTSINEEKQEIIIEQKIEIQQQNISSSSSSSSDEKVINNVYSPHQLPSEALAIETEIQLVPNQQEKLQSEVQQEEKSENSHSLLKTILVAKAIEERREDKHIEQETIDTKLKLKLLKEKKQAEEKEKLRQEEQVKAQIQLIEAEKMRNQVSKQSSSSSSSEEKNSLQNEKNAQLGEKIVVAKLAQQEIKVEKAQPKLTPKQQKQADKLKKQEAEKQRKEDEKQRKIAEKQQKELEKQQKEAEKLELEAAKLQKQSEQRAATLLVEAVAIERLQKKEEQKEDPKQKLKQLKEQNKIEEEKGKQPIILQENVQLTSINQLSIEKEIKQDFKKETRLSSSSSSSSSKDNDKQKKQNQPKIEKMIKVEFIEDQIEKARPILMEDTRNEDQNKADIQNVQKLQEQKQEEQQQIQQQQQNQKDENNKNKEKSNDVVKELLVVEALAKTSQNRPQKTKKQQKKLEEPNLEQIKIPKEQKKKKRLSSSSSSSSLDSSPEKKQPQQNKKITSSNQLNLPADNQKKQGFVMEAIITEAIISNKQQQNIELDDNRSSQIIISYETPKVEQENKFQINNKVEQQIEPQSHFRENYTFDLQEPGTQIDYYNQQFHQKQGDNIYYQSLDTYYDPARQEYIEAKKQNNQQREIKNDILEDQPSFIPIEQAIQESQRTATFEEEQSHRPIIIQSEIIGKEVLKQELPPKVDINQSRQAELYQDQEFEVQLNHSKHEPKLNVNSVLENQQHYIISQQNEEFKIVLEQHQPVQIENSEETYLYQLPNNQNAKPSVGKWQVNTFVEASETLKLILENQQYQVKLPLIIKQTSQLIQSEAEAKECHNLDITNMLILLLKDNDLYQAELFDCLLIIFNHEKILLDSEHSIKWNEIQIAKISVKLVQLLGKANLTKSMKNRMINQKDIIILVNFLDDCWDEELVAAIFLCLEKYCVSQKVAQLLCQYEIMAHIKKWMLKLSSSAYLLIGSLCLNNFAQKEFNDQKIHSIIVKSIQEQNIELRQNCYYALSCLCYGKQQVQSDLLETDLLFLILVDLEQKVEPTLIEAAGQLLANLLYRAEQKKVESKILVTLLLKQAQLQNHNSCLLWILRSLQTLCLTRQNSLVAVSESVFDLLKRQSQNKYLIKNVLQLYQTFAVQQLLPYEQIVVVKFVLLSNKEDLEILDKTLQIINSSIKQFSKKICTLDNLQIFTQLIEQYKQNEKILFMVLTVISNLACDKENHQTINKSVVYNALEFFPNNTQIQHFSEKIKSTISNSKRPSQIVQSAKPLILENPADKLMRGFSVILYLSGSENKTGYLRVLPSNELYFQENSGEIKERHRIKQVIDINMQPNDQSSEYRIYQNQRFFKKDLFFIIRGKFNNKFNTISGQALLVEQKQELKQILGILFEKQL